MSNKLQEFKDSLSAMAHGMTKREAHTQGVCVNCKQKPKFFSYAGEQEYRISGLCEPCFDLITDPELCKHCGTPESWHRHHLTPCEKFELDAICADCQGPLPTEPRKVFRNKDEELICEDCYTNKFDLDD